MSRVVSVRLDDDLLARLDKLAGALDRPRSWIIEQAIAGYIDEQTWQVEAITKAPDEYRSGTAKLRPHDEVMSRLARRLKR